MAISLNSDSGFDRRPPPGPSPAPAPPPPAVSPSSNVTEIDDSRPPVQVNPQDPPEIWMEVFNRVMAALQDMPEGARRQIALGIATQAQTEYTTRVQQGEAPGAARLATLGTADGRIKGEQGQNGITPGTGLPGDGLDQTTVVTTEDVQKATDAYRDGIKSGQVVRKGIIDYVPDPSAKDTVKPITTRDVQGRDVQSTDVEAQTITNPQRLAAALQRETTVGTTSLDTAAADQARGLQLANVGDLQAAARGEGAAGKLAAARLAQALRSNSATASGIAQGARGYARKGATRTAALAANQAGIDAAGKLEEINAATSLESQRQLGSALQGVRTQDLDQAATSAKLESDRKDLQARLDAARAANDQAAINDLTKQLADLKQRTKEFNATQRQTADTGNADRGLQADASNADRDVRVDTGNADRDVQGQTTTNDQGLKAWELDETARVQNERLKLDAQAAIEKSAQGLLDEAQREATLSMARKQLELAEKRFQLETDQAKKAEAAADRDFWMKVLSTLVSRVAPVALPGAPKAAHGGLVTEPQRVLVGEAGPEIILPVDDVTARLAKALALDQKPFDRADAPSLPALLAALKGMAPREEAPRLPPKVVVLLAAANNRARKSA